MGECKRKGRWKGRRGREGGGKGRENNGREGMEREGRGITL